MTPPDRPFLPRHMSRFAATIRDGWLVLRQRGPGQVQFWFIALLIGIVAGFAAVLFRRGISGLQAFVPEFFAGECCNSQKIR